MHTCRHRHLHDPVVGGMKLHFVDASTVAIERTQAWAMQIGLFAQFHQFTTRELAQDRQLTCGPVAAIAFDTFSQDAIGLPQVARRQGAREILEGVGLEVGGMDVNLREPWLADMPGDPSMTGNRLDRDPDRSGWPIPCARRPSRCLEVATTRCRTVRMLRLAVGPAMVPMAHDHLGKPTEMDRPLESDQGGSRPSLATCGSGLLNWLPAESSNTISTPKTLRSLSLLVSCRMID